MPARNQDTRRYSEKKIWAVQTHSTKKRKVLKAFHLKQDYHAEAVFLS